MKILYHVGETIDMPGGQGLWSELGLPAFLILLV